MLKSNIVKSNAVNIISEQINMFIHQSSVSARACVCVCVCVCVTYVNLCNFCIYDNFFEFKNIQYVLLCTVM